MMRRVFTAVYFFIAVVMLAGCTLSLDFDEEVTTGDSGQDIDNNDGDSELDADDTEDGGDQDTGDMNTDTDIGDTDTVDADVPPMCAESCAAPLVCDTSLDPPACVCDANQNAYDVAAEGEPPRCVQVEKVREIPLGRTVSPYAMDMRVRDGKLQVVLLETIAMRFWNGDQMAGTGDDGVDIEITADNNQLAAMPSPEVGFSGDFIIAAGAADDDARQTVMHVANTVDTYYGARRRSGSFVSLVDATNGGYVLSFDDNKFEAGQLQDGCGSLSGTTEDDLGSISVCYNDQLSLMLGTGSTQYDAIRFRPQPGTPDRWQSLVLADDGDYLAYGITYDPRPDQVILAPGKTYTTADVDWQPADARLFYLAESLAVVVSPAGLWGVLQATVENLATVKFPMDQDTKAGTFEGAHQIATDLWLISENGSPAILVLDEDPVQVRVVPLPDFNEDFEFLNGDGQWVVGYPGSDTNVFSLYRVLPP